MFLSSSESLLIWRRREGATQNQMGVAYGLSRNSYGRRERGSGIINVPHIAEEFLSDAERCLIYRKRAGLTQSEVSRLVGISRFWVNQKEMGHVDSSDLLTFWIQRQ